MTMIVTDCPRCHAQNITFDVKTCRFTYQDYGWRDHYEIYSECRKCFKGSIIVIEVKDVDVARTYYIAEKVLEIKTGLNFGFDPVGYISIKDEGVISPPEHMPQDVELAFREGASCYSINCYNASGAMFRLSIDLATKSILPEGDATTGGPNRQQRKNLHDRIQYLLEQRLISPDLCDLASCIKDNGDDGAHDGTLKKADAEDIRDFATELFRRMFTEPERLRLAQVRRAERSRQ